MSKNFRMPAALETLDASLLASWLRSQGWVWPTLEVAHLFGMILLVGSLVFVDLRILGFAPEVPLAPLSVLLNFAMLGFAMNVATGSLLILGDLDFFLNNPALWAKLGLIAAAGLNAVFFTLKMRRNPIHFPTGVTARVSAALSLVFWATVIVLARFISYTESMS